MVYILHDDNTEVYNIILVSEEFKQKDADTLVRYAEKYSVRGEVRLYIIGKTFDAAIKLKPEWNIMFVTSLNTILREMFGENYVRLLNVESLNDKL